MRIVGLATSGVESLFEGRPVWLQWFDPEANEGVGQAQLTILLDQAQRFESFTDAMNTWRSRSKARPDRDDGKPNRPLTAFHVEIVDLTTHPGGV